MSIQTAEKQELTVKPLEEWTSGERLEVARLVLNPKASTMGELEANLARQIPPELVAIGFRQAYSSAWAVWQGERCVLSCSMGVFPFPAFHFSHDGSLERSEVTSILNRFLDSQSGDVLAFMERLALGKWAARHLGFYIVSDGLFNMGLGERHYFLFNRPQPTLSPSRSSERVLA